MKIFLPLITLILCAQASATPPGQPAKLAFIRQPSADTVRGVPFATAPAVAVQDSEGNTVTSDNSCVVGLALVSYDGSGRLLANAKYRTTVNGWVDYSNSDLRLSADSAAGTYRILAEGFGTCRGIFGVSEEVMLR